MGGPASAKPKSALDVVKEALASLSAAGDADSPSEQKQESAPPPPEAADAAQRARKNYDSLIRWILGFFTALGLLIFGSVPFADLENVGMWDGAGQGLIIAGLGLIVVVLAATTGLELQDASLGELKDSLEYPPENRDGSVPRAETGTGQTPTAAAAAQSANARADQDKADKPKLRTVGKPWRWLWVTAPSKASERLGLILYGHEREAHLGPGIESVGALISMIGTLEDELMKVETGSQSPIKRKAIVEAVSNELQVTGKVLTELRTQLVNDAPNKNTIGQQIRDQETRYSNLVNLLPSTDEIKQSGEEALKLRKLERYLWHRSLLLTESAVAQLRGTFRLVRGWLIVGAVLTLAGGLLYTSAVANPSEEGINSLVLVNVVKDTEAWNALKKCASGDSDIVELEALLESSRDADGLQDGPFSIIATEGECAGTEALIQDGGGKYRLPLVGTTPEAQTPIEGEEANSVVVVTIKANTQAWKQAAACRPANNADPLTGLLALLRDASDRDALGDGPFTISTIDVRCPGLVISVADGDGSYELQPSPPA